MARTRTRTQNRRSLRLECLEGRQVLSAVGGPSPDQLYMLERVNWARQNPSAAAQWAVSSLDPSEVATAKYYNVDLGQAQQQIASTPARPPLAWNNALAQAAQGQSQYQADTGNQTHTGPNGSNLDQRLDGVGYSNRLVDGENAYAYSQSVDQAMQAFLIDWGVPDQGHRRNILQPDASQPSYREVGIGIVNSNNNGLGPLVITQDYGAQNGSNPYLLGIAYNDKNNDNFYQPGEGLGDVTVTAVNAQNGQSQSVQTWASGGYQLQLAPGTYNVTAVENGQTLLSQQVTLGNDNVELNVVEHGGPPASPPQAQPQSQPQAQPQAAPASQSAPVQQAAPIPQAQPTPQPQPQPQPQASQPMPTVGGILPGVNWQWQSWSV